jgi:hypothetical protein
MSFKEMNGKNNNLLHNKACFDTLNKMLIVLWQNIADLYNIAHDRLMCSILDNVAFQKRELICI